ncbi:uncharacterized protein A4U43_C07F18790 [Asparagus officinalis]|uniref:Fe2OG dioxygenase domain-containing protein n=1 Tax=Asparagus officinalis TaxID=4686 RepID=A0A5P1ED82_ASPOF|nr:2'-deoxymugineic-acid 2'-dioxygenase-like [Asparagus officinalis]ONK63774.1 uncharacterized protein A4U43_C07F18790 [Asparagus officinalis]
MEKLVSDGLSRGSVVPETYIFPGEQRPNTVRTCESIPVVDLQGGSEDEVVREILKAGKEYGFFQVINHGIPEDLVNDMISVAQEFFEMPAENKACYYSEDPRKEPRLFTGQGYGKELSLYWRDCFIISAYPVAKFEHLFPEKPDNLKEIMSKFAPEAKGLAARLLRLISIGLGLEEDYLTGNRSGGPVKMVFNYYPRCPDPSLTLGLPKHCDPNLITLLLQGKVSGLQVLHDDRWVSVDPLPNAFVVNFGLLFEVVTNGLLKAVEHRAVTNHSLARTSIALPIRSADALLSKDNNPPLYGSFLFPEFFKIFATKKTDDKEIMMEDFRIKG